MTTKLGRLGPLASEKASPTMDSRYPPKAGGRITLKLDAANHDEMLVFCELGRAGEISLGIIIIKFLSGDQFLRWCFLSLTTSPPEMAHK